MKKHEISKTQAETMMAVSYVAGVLIPERLKDAGMEEAAVEVAKISGELLSQTTGMIVNAFFPDADPVAMAKDIKWLMDLYKTIIKEGIEIKVTNKSKEVAEA